MENKNNYPIILTILDGWGYTNNIEGNAIKLAKTPNINKILDENSISLLDASGEDVGLPINQMGNSEVGHTTIGSGRIIYQDLVRIKEVIDTGTFFNNLVIQNLFKTVSKRKSKLHVIGLCSNGGVHSHINHLLAIIKILKNQGSRIKTCLHLITDGRDTEPEIAIKFLDIIKKSIDKNPNIQISTISGRYYSMDRDCRWSRTEKTYKMLTEKCDNYIIKNYRKVIEKFYSENISDEFIPPTKLDNNIIDNNDGILFFNFRPDRIRQLIQSLAKPNFKGFNRKKIHNLLFATFTEYDNSLKIPVVFPTPNYKNFLGEIIAKNNYKQLRLAETEKYAHVTYFFNGGTDEPFPGEDRELIASPQVETYDLTPEMSAHKITDSLIDAIDKNLYKIIIVNYANADMLGHTGNLEATIKAIEVIDNCIGKIINKIQKTKIKLIITADHGNAEYMIDNAGKKCKSHSINPVPFVIVESNNKYNYSLKSKGSLADIGPTILDILNLDVPLEMTGKSLIMPKKEKNSVHLNNDI